MRIRTAVAVLLSVPFWPLITSPERHIQKQVEPVARVQVTIAEAESTAPQQEVQPQPEKMMAEDHNAQPSKVIEEPSIKPPTDRQQLMQLAGISSADWNTTNYIVSKESTWCYKRMNGDHRPCDSIPQPSVEDIGSKAYGLCQARPVTKMASAGADYMSNPVTQLKWCHDYAENRYGGWSEASTFWSSNSWW